MNPEQPQQPASQTPSTPDSFSAPAQPSASDDILGTSYLDQIAPSQQKTINRFAMFGLIGGILVLVVVVMAILMNSGGPNAGAYAAKLNDRIKTLQAVTDTHQKHLKETAVSEANTALSSALISMNTDLTALIKNNASLESKKDKKATDAEESYSETLQKKLDDAYQRGTLDRVYAPQMTYELTVLSSMLKNLQNSSRSKSVREFTENAIKNIDAVEPAFANFSSTR